MPKTIFFRNMSNYEELKSSYDKTENKKMYEYEIIGSIYLSQKEFDDFCKDFDFNFPFLKDYIDILKVVNDVWRCIMVCCGDDKVLVMTNGYQYPRFTALI